MLYMVIETFKAGRQRDIYERARQRGRMLPAGLEYLDSWVSDDLRQCFQLMACEDPALLARWQRHWEDLVDFECIPVLRSADAAALVLRQ